MSKGTKLVELIGVLLDENNAVFAGGGNVSCVEDRLIHNNVE